MDPSLSRDPFSHTTPLGSGLTVHTWGTRCSNVNRVPLLVPTSIHLSVYSFIHAFLAHGWPLLWDTGSQDKLPAGTTHPPSRASSQCAILSTHLRVDGSQAEKTEKDFPKEDDRAQREAAIAGVPKGLQSLC